MLVRLTPHPLKESRQMKTFAGPLADSQQDRDARRYGSQMSRRAFLGAVGAALLAGCGAPSPSSGGSARDGTPTLAPAVPASRIEPENASRMTLLGVLHAETTPVRGLAWSPDGSTLAMSAYQSAQLWDVKTGQRLATLRGHTSGVDWVAWSPDGSMLATASLDGTD